MPSSKLSLSWGPSFAESENSQDWLRFYTPQVPVPQHLKTLAGKGPFQARLSLSVMRKILDTRLGNSVAQVVTKGFENWVLLRQEAEPGHFDLAPSRREPLTNPGNLFGLKERVSASGEVLTEVDVNELAKIAADLKKNNIERVCVNLLFSHRNSKNQNLVTRFFEEQGLQVFSRVRAPHSQDELSAWRRNLLDASLSSFFEKIKSEIEEALPGSQIELLDTELGFASANQVSTSGLLFGRERSLQREKPLLYFGPEEWSWILPSEQPQWKSPWGALELHMPSLGFFSLQPGSELQLTASGRTKWGADSTMDPGPMMWGRSSKISLLDLLGWELETTPPLRRNEKNEAKTKEQIQSLQKNSRDWSKIGAEAAKSDVLSHLIEVIFSDLSTLSHGNEFDVGGAFAPALLPHLQKTRPQWTWNPVFESRKETAQFWEPR